MRPSTRLRVVRAARSEEHTSELQSPCNLVCRLLLEKKKERNSDSAGLVSVAQTRVFCRTWSCRARVRQYELLLDSPCSLYSCGSLLFFFFFNDRGPPGFSPFPLHAAFPF